MQLSLSPQERFSPAIGKKDNKRLGYKKERMEEAEEEEGEEGLGLRG